MQTSNAKQVSIAGFGNPVVSLYPVFAMLDDSMDDGLKSGISVGDIVAGRILDSQLWGTPVRLAFYLHSHLGKQFILATDEGATIATITHTWADEERIFCSCLNPDKGAYPDFEMRFTDIRGLHRVVAVTRMLDTKGLDTLVS